jgi:hypothetical protein
MSDENRVEIPIVTTADTGGAQRQAVAIKEVAQASKEANVATRDGASATADHGKEVEDLEKKTGFLNLRKTELKKLVRELGQEFPIAAQAARAFMNPLVFALTMAIGLFAKAKEALDSWGVRMDEMAKRNAGRDFLPGIEAKKQALHEAAVEAAGFQSSLAAIGTAEDTFIKKMDASITKLHEWIAAQAEVNNAAEARELAGVNLQEKLGRLTPEQAILKRGDIKTKYETKADALKTEAENKEFEAKRAELGHLQTEAPSLQKERDTRAAAVAALKSRLAQNKKDVETQKSFLPEDEKTYDEASAKFDKAREYYQQVSKFGHTGAIKDLDELEFSKAKEEMEQATAIRDRRRLFIKQLQDKADKGEIGLQGAGKALDVSSQRVTQNRERQKALGEEITGLQDTLPMRQQSRQQAGALKQQTRHDEETEALLATPEGQEVLQLYKDAKAMQRGDAARAAKSSGRIGPDTNAVIAAGDKAQADAEALAEKIFGTTRGLGEFLNRTIKAVEELNGQVRGQHTRMDNLEREIQRGKANQAFHANYG